MCHQHPCQLDLQIQSKISDWRAKFVSSCLETWTEILSDPALKALFVDQENVAEYAQYLRGDGHGRAPFYWKEWNDGNKKIVSEVRLIL